MLNFGSITKEDIKEHNPNWSEILDHPYRILIVGGSKCGKANALLNLINHKPDKDPHEAKYRLLINKRESTGLRYLNDLKAFIEYSNAMDDIDENTEGYNPNKKLKILIVFDDMIADMLSNKKLNPTVTEAAPKNIRLSSIHYIIMKIPNKRELQQIAFNHSSDIDFQDFMNLHKKCTAESFSFLVIDTTLASDNSLCFRKILLKSI